MTVKELIILLLNEDMDATVVYQGDEPEDSDYNAIDHKVSKIEEGYTHEPSGVFFQETGARRYAPNKAVRLS
jgi:hypothetical protein